MVGAVRFELTTLSTHADALPGCATLRQGGFADAIDHSDMLGAVQLAGPGGPADQCVRSLSSKAWISRSSRLTSSRAVCRACREGAGGAPAPGGSATGSSGNKVAGASLSIDRPGGSLSRGAPSRSSFWTPRIVYPS